MVSCSRAGETLGRRPAQTDFPFSIKFKLNWRTVVAVQPSCLLRLWQSGIVAAEDVAIACLPGEAVSQLMLHLVMALSL